MTNPAHSIPLPQQMFQMITGFWVSQALGAFSELALADELAGGPRTAAQLAATARTDPDATFRLLRMLATVGVVAHDGEAYALTPLGATLRSDVPGSMRDMARAQTAPGHWLPWGRLRDAVRTGSRQTGAALGAEIFSYYESQPAERAMFLGAMRGLSAAAAVEAPRVYDATPHRTVCDVGGSAGNVACGFLRTNPQLRGVVFALPEVAPLATRSIADAGLSERCTVVGGDFFADVPAADLYLLKHILHDWSDDQCKTILANIARRIEPNGRVLVIEMVIPDDSSPSAAQLMDVNMLVMLPGRERTVSQYAALLAAAGLSLVDVRPTHSPMSVIVAER